VVISTQNQRHDRPWAAKAQGAGFLGCGKGHEQAPLVFRVWKLPMIRDINHIEFSHHVKDRNAPVTAPFKQQPAAKAAPVAPPAAKPATLKMRHFVVMLSFLVCVLTPISR